MRSTAIQYVGVDLHQATLVCVVKDEAGQTTMESKVATRREAIESFVRGLGGRVRIAFEEGTQALFFPNENADACADALAQTLDHSSSPDATAARVDAAFRRAQELSFERYIGEMGQFVADAHAAFRPETRPIGSPV